MRVGQLIGAGYGKEITLFCVVKEIDNNEVYGNVINGNWRITFRPTETICHSPSGPAVIPAKILYTGNIPAHLKHEFHCSATYTEALEFMNSRLNSYVPLWVYSLMGNVEVRFARLVNALYEGKQAFLNAWNPPRESRNDYNDDIPF